MLQIRLSKPVTDVGASAKPGPGETVTVACPDHLILAELPVATSLGTPIASAVVKTVGRKSRRQLGERIHFCVLCDFPIAIYGRLLRGADSKDPNNQNDGRNFYMCSTSLSQVLLEEE